jgi:hypothetical protein
MRFSTAWSSVGVVRLAVVPVAVVNPLQHLKLLAPEAQNGRASQLWPLLEPDRDATRSAQ